MAECILPTAILGNVVEISSTLITTPQESRQLMKGAQQMGPLCELNYFWSTGLCFSLSRYCAISSTLFEAQLT
jgi:hypothetical protein